MNDKPLYIEDLTALDADDRATRFAALAAGPNVRLEYLYRDADNYKASREVVLDGPITEAEVAAIVEQLDSDCWFIPSQVGLANLQDQFDTLNPDSDHVWHELIRLEATNVEPSDVSVGDLVVAFRDVTWDEVAASREIGLQLETKE